MDSFILMGSGDGLLGVVGKTRVGDVKERYFRGKHKRVGSVLVEGADS